MNYNKACVSLSRNKRGTRHRCILCFIKSCLGLGTCIDLFSHWCQKSGAGFPYRKTAVSLTEVSCILTNSKFFFNPESNFLHNLLAAFFFLNLESSFIINILRKSSTFDIWKSVKLFVLDKLADKGNTLDNNYVIRSDKRDLVASDLVKLRFLNQSIPQASFYLILAFYDIKLCVLKCV